MALPASKRRKIQHSSSEDDASSSSFGDLDSASDEVGILTNGHALNRNAKDELVRKISAGDGVVAQHNDQDGHTEEAGEDDVGLERQGSVGSNDESRHNDANSNVILEADISSAPTKPAKVATRNANERARTARSALEASGSAYNAGTFKSNVFKIQVDELLAQIRPRRGKREEAADAALHTLKCTIDSIPAREVLSTDDAESSLLKLHRVSTPFPDPRPPKDARYKLAYAKPANINVTGSYALKTSARSKAALQIDMTLTMPSSLFQDKDYLNHRYFHKRAYYLACIAASLTETHGKEYRFIYVDFHGDQLKPMLAISPLQSAPGSVASKLESTWQINIIPCLRADLFAEDKLTPNRNCVRPASTAEPQPTPFYNASLRADMLTASYLRLINTAASSCPAFRDACLLGSTWQRQRGLESAISPGGFGNFEWSALISLLLQGGGPHGKPILSEGYSSYQLFKATLQILATRDMSKQALVLGGTSDAVSPATDGSPMLWDGVRRHNLLYKMSPWSYRVLRQQARTTLAPLSDQLFDGFAVTFVLRADNEILRYDWVVEIPSAGLPTKQAESPGHSNLYHTLRRGLGDRVSEINIISSGSDAWDLASAKPTAVSDNAVKLGLVVSAENVNRAVDHGPSAENKTEAADFRKFWGEKAELRRFKDGSILESLVWTPSEGGKSVLEQVIRYLVRHHLSDEVEQSLTFHGDGVGRMLAETSTSAVFQPMMEAYKKLESDIRRLNGLPLSVRQIMPADPQLRYASIQAPASAAASSVRSSPADVTIQFEGSARWPDDLQAIQRTKIAFLLKLSELIQASVPSVTPRIGLENERHDVMNQAFLDIIYDSGAAFRLRIHHDREQTLLERVLRDKALAPPVREPAARGLSAYKRLYIATPAHTLALARLCGRHPALSGSIRLTKKWFASHLLHDYFAEEVIELMVAHTFVQPWPWQAPSSIQTGFLRTLHWLARWDWRAEPLLVDLSGTGELRPAEAKAVQTRFEAWRKLDPSLNRVTLFVASNVAAEGTTWTDGLPAKVVASRMTALARAAMAVVQTQGLQLQVAELFSSPTEDFDFVLHLDPDVVDGRGRRKGATAFKNLELEALGDSSRVGFDPVADFLAELQELYGSAVVLFSGGKERLLVAGLWSPQTAAAKWRINLGFSSTPIEGEGPDDVRVRANREAMMAEMARLGGEIVSRVEANR